MNDYDAPEPTSALDNIAELLARWELTPALRKGTAAVELRATMKRGMVTDLDGLDALLPGTLLLSTVTGNPWRTSDHEAIFVEGMSGAYSFAKDFLSLECPAIILTVPTSEATR